MQDAMFLQQLIQVGGVTLSSLLDMRKYHRFSSIAVKYLPNTELIYYLPAA
jgi:hypothetical protein